MYCCNTHSHNKVFKSLICRIVSCPKSCRSTILNNQPTYSDWSKTDIRDLKCYFDNTCSQFANKKHCLQDCSCLCYLWKTGIDEIQLSLSSIWSLRIILNGYLNKLTNWGAMRISSYKNGAFCASPLNHILCLHIIVNITGVNYYIALYFL